MRLIPLPKEIAALPQAKRTELIEAVLCQKPALAIYRILPILAGLAAASVSYGTYRHERGDDFFVFLALSPFSWIAVFHLLSDRFLYGPKLAKAVSSYLAPGTIPSEADALLDLATADQAEGNQAQSA